MTKPKIPSYAYTLVKISSLDELLLNSSQLRQIKHIDSIERLIKVIAAYYPDLEHGKKSPRVMKNNLIKSFIKKMGDLITISPNSMRNFLKNFLMKYEIKNIKYLIRASISSETKNKQKDSLILLVEEYLNNKSLISRLIEAESEEEIEYIVQKSQYYEAVKEGLIYYKKTGRFLVLDAFLEQYYYQNLYSGQEIYSKTEKLLFSSFARYYSELFNIQTILNGITKNVDRRLVFQFLVEDYQFLSKKLIRELVSIRRTEEFFRLLGNVLSNINGMEDFSVKLTRNHLKDNFIWELESAYRDHFLTTFSPSGVEIDYKVIYNVLKFIIQKEQEIKLVIIPRLEGIWT